MSWSSGPPKWSDPQPPYSARLSPHISTVLSGALWQSPFTAGCACHSHPPPSLISKPPGRHCTSWGLFGRHTLTDKPSLLLAHFSCISPVHTHPLPQPWHHCRSTGRSKATVITTFSVTVPSSQLWKQLHLLFKPCITLTVCVSWWLLVFPVNICLLASWWKYIALYSKNFCQTWISAQLWIWIPVVKNTDVRGTCEMTAKRCISQSLLNT